MRKAVRIATLIGCLFALPRPGAAQVYQAPWRFELSLEPGAGTSVLGFPLNTSGLQVVAPERGNNATSVGVGTSFGILATPLLEPGLAFSFLYASLGGGTTNNLTEVGMTPFLKLNLWVNPHVNPFFQPFAGFLLIDVGSTNTFFDGGLFAGVEGLVTSWGLRVWTGFEYVQGNNTHVFGIPVRWALVAYF
ncbi:MAG TPA: hypothetical protein VKN99_11875 [Polyangia bacterium]|nr:hypothetical protein [Polyangia bacterium]